MKLRFEQLEPRNMLSLLLGTPGDDVFAAGPGWANLNGTAYVADEFVFDGLGGNDVARLYDSAGNDTFTASPGVATLVGNRVLNCEIIHGYAKAGGDDVARLYDSAGDDTFITKTQWGKLRGDGFYLRAKFFETTEGYASDGVDVASLNDSTGDDIAHINPGDMLMFSPELGDKRAIGFDYAHAYARYGGYDTAHLYGEYYTTGSNYCRMFDVGSVNRAKLFEEVLANRERVNAATYQPDAGETMTLIGTHTLRRAIELRDGDTLTGTATLTRQARNQAELTAAARTGDTTIYVDSTAGFLVGDELGLYAYGEAPSWVVVSGVGSEWVTIETPVYGLYEPSEGAALTNYFPLVRAIGTNITIEGLTLDGNHDLTTHQWQITGGGLIHAEMMNSVIRNVTVVDAYSTGILLRGGRDNLIENTTVLRSRGHGMILDEEIDATVRDCISSWNGYQIVKVLGDGILVNGGSNHLVEGCVTNHNRRYGLHPAGELTRGGIWHNNEASYNDSNGFHFCFNNYDISVTGNNLHFNRSGVGGLGSGGEYADRFNIVTGNWAQGNRRYGVETNGGGDNVITFNDLRYNGLGGILIVGDHLVLGNLD